MEAREAQQTFNDIADIIDFTPEVFSQDNWGTGLTMEQFKDSNGVEEGVVHVYDEDEGTQSTFEIGGDIGDLEACGTTCCVAGWTALLKGWHGTALDLLQSLQRDTFCISITHWNVLPH